MNYNAMHSVPSWTLPFRWHDKRLSHPWGKLEHKDQEGQSRDSRGMLLLVGLSGIFNRSPNTTASACSGWIPSLLFSLLLSIFHVLFSLFSQFWRPARMGLLPQSKSPLPSSPYWWPEQEIYPYNRHRSRSTIENLSLCEQTARNRCPWFGWFHRLIDGMSCRE